MASKDVFMSNEECTTKLKPHDKSGRHPSAREFFCDEDYAWIEHLANYWTYFDQTCSYSPETDDEQLAQTGSYSPATDDEELGQTCARLAGDLLRDDPRSFVCELEDDVSQTYQNYGDDTFARLVILGLEYGVACCDGLCANWLGAMYYMGDVVEQDYFKAQELYELAQNEGVAQAMINLGYIYEYGRTGEPDHLKAFMQYAKAAAMYDAPEALYKLGDMYSRAKVVKQDLYAAYVLYQKSFINAQTIDIQAQPAIRIANLISDRENSKWGIPYDPMQALELYQLAERGLRVDIAQGATYYSKRLHEAMEGQERVRRLLSSSE